MSYDLKFMAYPAYPMINRRERFTATTIPHSQKSSHGSPVGATTAEFPSECPNGNAMIFPSAHAKFTNLWWLNHHFPWSSSDNFPHLKPMKGWERNRWFGSHPLPRIFGLPTVGSWQHACSPRSGMLHHYWENGPICRWFTSWKGWFSID